MRTWRQINGFRLFVVVGISLTTSAAMFFADEDLSRGEIFNGIIQAAIVAFSFLQCPESNANKPTRGKGEQANGTT